jgi:hypothetical protein
MALSDCSEITPVGLIETHAVNAELSERIVDRNAGYVLVPGDRRKVAYASQQTNGHARRAAGAVCDLTGPIICQFNAEREGATPDDRLKVFRRVGTKSQQNAKPVAERLA